MPEFGHSNQYTGLLNGLNTLLVYILKIPYFMSILPLIPPSPPPETLKVLPLSIRVVWDKIRVVWTLPLTLAKGASKKKLSTCLADSAF